jgi:hypothetical protein
MREKDNEVKKHIKKREKGERKRRERKKKKGRTIKQSERR